MSDHPGNRVIGYCKLPDMGASKQTQSFERGIRSPFCLIKTRCFSHIIYPDYGIPSL